MIPARIIKKLFTIEGFRSDHPADSGGLTTYGVSKKFWPQYYKKWGGPPNRIQAAEFYEIEFWNPLRLGEIHDSQVAFEMFEQAVNLGIRRASRFAQLSVNLVRQVRRTLVVDGRVGLKTIDAINRLRKRDTLRLLTVLNGTQYMYYLYRTGQMDATLKLFHTTEREDQAVFFRGWLSRIEFTDD